VSAASPPTLDAYLPQTAWLRRLASALAAGDDADDVVQEVWERALKERAIPRAPRAWLATVARNVSNAHIRADVRRRRREASAASPTEGSPTPEDALAKRESLDRVAILVDDLDEPYRATVLQHYFGGQSLAEIARTTGVPAGTVRWRLKIAHDRLRSRLDAAHEGRREGWLPLFASLGSPLVPQASIPLAAAIAWTCSKIVAAVVIVWVAFAAASTQRVVHEVAPVPVDVTSEPAATADVPVLDSLQQGPKERPRRADPGKLAEPPVTIAGSPLREARIEYVAAHVAFEDMDGKAKMNEDHQFLGDLEQMIILEDAAALGEACRLEAPPSTPRDFEMKLTLYADGPAGTVIETVETNDPTEDAFSACIRESFHQLRWPPQGENAPVDAWFTVALDEAAGAVTVAFSNRAAMPSNELKER